MGPPRFFSDATDSHAVATPRLTENILRPLQFGEEGCARSATGATTEDADEGDVVFILR